MAVVVVPVVVVVFNVEALASQQFFMSTAMFPRSDSVGATTGACLLSRCSMDPNRSRVTHRGERESDL